MANFKTGRSRQYNRGIARLNDKGGSGMMLGELFYDVCVACFLPVTPNDHDNLIIFSIRIWKNWSVYERNNK